MYPMQDEVTASNLIKVFKVLKIRPGNERR